MNTKNPTPATLKIATERAIRVLHVRNEVPGIGSWEDLRCAAIERPFGAWWRVVLAGTAAESPHLRQALTDLLKDWGYGDYCDIDVVTQDDTCLPEDRTPHTDDLAVDRFALEIKRKLAAARAKGRAGWETCDSAVLRAGLRDHIEKGDPRDVAAYALFLWARGESTHG